MAARRVTLQIQSPIAFGDVTMVPAPLCGRPEAEMARAMAAALSDVDAPTHPTSISGSAKPSRWHR